MIVDYLIDCSPLDNGKSGAPVGGMWGSEKGWNGAPHTRAKVALLGCVPSGVGKYLSSNSLLRVRPLYPFVLNVRIQRSVNGWINCRPEHVGAL